MHKVFSIISSGTENAQTENKITLALSGMRKPVEQSLFYRERLVMHMGYQDFEKSLGSLVASGQVGRKQDGAAFYIWSKVQANQRKVEEPEV